MPVGPSYRPAPTWPALPRLHDVVEVARFPEHRLRWRHEAAAEVGLDPLTDAEWLDHFGRFHPLPDNLPQPLALRYHGHQFGHYNPALGDGRGVLFAQLRDHRDRLLDLGTKGTGPTPYSRGGDGKLTLQGAVREVLASELLAARGVDTCRILSVVETGEDLFRTDEPSPTRSAVMVRLSHSHVRIGTFQRLAFYEDREGLEALVAYVAEHLLPDVEGPVDLLRVAGTRLFATCSAWMAAGFVHGVLNTDNLNVTGESFDYGPWRFLQRWDPRFTAAYFDHQGYYAFGRQPWAVGWSLARLAGALALIADIDALQATLDDLVRASARQQHVALLRRLGVAPRDPAGDEALARSLVTFLEEAPLTVDEVMWDWHGGVAGAERAMRGPRAERYAARAFDPVRRALTGYDGPTDDDSPLVGLPDDEVKALWAHIAEGDDWGPLHERIAQLRRSR